MTHEQPINHQQVPHDPAWENMHNAFAQIRAAVAAPVDHSRPLDTTMADVAARNARGDFLADSHAYAAGSTMSPDSGIDAEGRQFGADLFTAAAEDAGEQARQDQLDLEETSRAEAAKRDQELADKKAEREAAHEAEIQKEIALMREEKVRAHQEGIGAEMDQAIRERRRLDLPGKILDASTTGNWDEAFRMLNEEYEDATRTGNWSTFNAGYDLLGRQEAAYTAYHENGGAFPEPAPVPESSQPSGSESVEQSRPAEDDGRWTFDGRDDSEDTTRPATARDPIDDALDDWSGVFEPVASSPGGRSNGRAPAALPSTRAQGRASVPVAADQPSAARAPLAPEDQPVLGGRFAGMNLAQLAGIDPAELSEAELLDYRAAEDAAFDRALHATPTESETGLVGVLASPSPGEAIPVAPMVAAQERGSRRGFRRAVAALGVVVLANLVVGGVLANVMRGGPNPSANASPSRPPAATASASGKPSPLNLPPSASQSAAPVKTGTAQGGQQGTEGRQGNPNGNPNTGNGNANTPPASTVKLRHGQSIWNNIVKRRLALLDAKDRPIPDRQLTPEQADRVAAETNRIMALNGWNEYQARHLADDTEVKV